MPAEDCFIRNLGDNASAGTERDDLKNSANDRDEPMAASARTYADHLRDWENARPMIAEGRALLIPDEFGGVSFSALAVWFHKHGTVLLDAAENLLDASAFKDSVALRRQTEIVQRLGADHA